MKEIVKKIVAICGGVVLIGSVVWAGVAQTQANHNADALANAVTALNAAQLSNNNLNNDLDALNAQMAEFGVTIDTLENVVAGNEQIIADYEAEIAALEEEANAEDEIEVITNTGYDLDEFGLAETITESITENDYSVMLDSDVEFDGDDYGFEEVLSFTATSDINGDDYNEDTFLVFDEGDMEYKLIFDNDLDTSLISEDETLKINFLGKELEITEWDVDKITIKTGEDFLLNVGDNITFNDKVVTLNFAGDEEVLVSVDGVVDSIREDHSEEINGLDIKLDFSAEGTMAKLIISDADDETVIESGDEFAEDSLWEYKITANEIGLISVEDLTDLDEDSDFNALAAGESVTLPNDYLSLTYNGIKDVDMIDVKFSEKNGFVKIKGDFVNGLDDFDLVYANATGFYDEDYELISTDNIEIDDTDSLIELDNGTLVIEDVVLNLDFSDALINGNSVANKNDNHRSSFGIVAESPEDNLDDEELKLLVPEEEVEVSITVN